MALPPDASIFVQTKEGAVLRLFALLVLAFTPAPLAADTPLTGDQILLRAREAAGGDEWANARTLVLSGRAVFYGAAGHAPTSAPDSYAMWRVFDPNRQAAHGAEGKVRITIKDRGRLVMDVGYNGIDTWNEKGIIPKAQADAFWASNFGFGIIRHAGKPGFSAQRLPDDAVDGHASYMVELTDPAGTKSLFGVDRKSFAIRMVGFRTPRGWHVRTYQDFVTLEKPRWLQARHVTLYYDGRKANEVFWTSYKVNPEIDAALFDPPKP
jgi:hypothetical protein